MGDFGFSRTARFVIGLASLGIALVVLNRFSGFVNMLAVAVILGIVFTPLLGWLRRKGVPGWLALVVTLVAVLAVLAGLLLYLIFALNRLSTAVPTYAAEMNGLMANINDLLTAIDVGSGDGGVLFSLFDPQRMLDIIGQFLSQLMGILSDIVVVFLILAFLLAGASSLTARTQQLIEGGNTGLARLFHYNQTIRRYIIITNNMGLLAGAVNATFLLLLGVDFALLWGVLSWLLSYIPMVGFLLALIPPALLALLEFGWVHALIVVIGFILINSVIDDVVKPRIMGKGLDLAPVVVFVSVIFWGLILGPLGGILALPVTLAIKELVLEPDPDNRWLAALMGGAEEPVDSPAPSAAHSDPT